MFNEILELIRAWPIIAQVFISMVIATVITIISIAFIGYLGDFMNNALPVILRGYPPDRKEKSDDTEE